MSIESVNERELLSAASQGSQVAYRELIHLHQAAVYRFAWAMIGDEDAQTITENAFITAWRQLEYLKALNMTFREKLYQLVCIDCAELDKHRRRHKVTLPAAQDDETLNFAFGDLRYDPRTNMEHLALQTDIEEALRALPLRFRQVLLLHEMGDLADTQIADLTGDDAQTVHAYLERSRAFLRRQIILSGGFFPIESKERQDPPRKWHACKEYIPSLAAAADNLCTTAEKQMLAAHMSTCPGCQGYYDSLCAINHGITVMKREVPGDMASYIIHRIQQEEGKGDFAAPGEKHSHRPRFAFGRFSIIGLCIALVLLAYSNGILDRSEQAGPEQTPPPQSQTQAPPPEQQTAEPVSEDPGTAGSEELLLPEEGSTGEEDTPENGEGSGEDTPSIVPGGEDTSSSSTLIPAGETYAVVYITDGTGGDLLGQYSSLSFRANLADGRTAMYYVVPTSNAEALDTALDEAAVSRIAYTDEPDAIDMTADRMLYIVYLS